MKIFIEKKIPVRLNVKAGFHQDLNAKAMKEPIGPTFACNHGEINGLNKI